MNDVTILAVCFAVAIALMMCVSLYSIYGGVHDSLVTASSGTVYNFRYLQPLTGTYERYLAKVLNVRKLTKEEISRLNLTSDYRSGDKEFQRSSTLVTCKMSNGDIRQFYAERSDMCKRSLAGRLLYSTGYAHLF